MLSFKDSFTTAKQISHKLRSNKVLYDIVIAVFFKELNRIVELYYDYPDSNHLSNSKYILKDLEKNWLGDYIDTRKGYDYNTECIARWLTHLKKNEYSIAGGHESDEKDGPIQYTTCHMVKSIMEKYEL